MLSFFNGQLKPAIKNHYLSHLVASIEEMINEKEKQQFLVAIKNTEQDTQAVRSLKQFIEQKRIRLFSISLVAVASEKRKARTYKTGGGVIISYARYLQDNEKRFVIAHELGHIVQRYLLTGDCLCPEGFASLFAYIALLDKNNFYQTECKSYIVDTDLALFNDYRALLHK
ncbi:MAG: M48 family metalloprotease [Treponema sp.]|nr:M48 family metalloprotease [Treponema sp.]